MNLTLQANAPTAYNDSYTTEQNIAITLTPVVDDDYYTDSVSINIISVENGEATVNDLIVNFEPNTNFIGSANIIYSITDDLNQTSNNATITINVLADNLNEIEQNKFTLLDTEFEFNAFEQTNISNNNNTSITIIEQASKGSVQVVQQNILYSPNQGESGMDEFSYVLTQTNFEQVQVNVSVELLNQQQYDERINSISIQISDDEFTVIEDLSLMLNVMFNDSLNNQQDYEIEIVQNSSNGNVSIENQSVLYQPNANYSGNDQFTYKINHLYSEQSSNTATVLLNITEVNDVPTSDDFSLSTTNSITFDLFSHAQDVDGTLTAINIMTPPNNGLLILNANQATYSKVSGFVGNDRFTYTIEDNQGGVSEVIEVQIQVSNQEQNNTDEDGNVTLEVTGGAMSIYEIILLALFGLSIMYLRHKAYLNKKEYVKIKS